MFPTQEQIDESAKRIRLYVLGKETAYAEPWEKLTERSKHRWRTMVTEMFSDGYSIVHVSKMFRKKTKGGQDFDD